MKHLFRKIKISSMKANRIMRTLLLPPLLRREV